MAWPTCMPNIELLICLSIGVICDDRLEMSKPAGSMPSGMPSWERSPASI